MLVQDPLAAPFAFFHSKSTRDSNSGLVTTRSITLRPKGTVQSTPMKERTFRGISG